MSDKTIVACMLAGAGSCVIVLVAVMFYSHNQLLLLSGEPSFTTPETGMIEMYGGLARIDHRFGNEGDFGRPERFSESFAIDPVQVE